MKGRKLTSLLGLEFDGETLSAVLLQRSGQRVRIRKAFQSPLSLNPVTSDPNLAGREIRNRLTEAGIGERRCVVCVPLQWALLVQTEVPDLAEADLQSYLNLQAERRFPFGLEDLSISVSRYRSGEGMRGATLAAIPRNHLNALMKTLHAAKLRPIGITLGVTSLTEAGPQADGTAVFLVGNQSVDFAVSCGGGLVALRSIGGKQSAEGAEEAPDIGDIPRQVRITLGLMPASLQNAIQVARVFGPEATAEPVLGALREASARLGMDVQSGDLRTLLPALEGDVSRDISPGVLAAAALRLSGATSTFEFLPAQVSRLKQLTGRISSRATRWLAVAAAVLVVSVGGAMIYQYARLSRLESNWKTMEPKVTHLGGLQERIRRFRPWFDPSNRSLQIARAVTEAFPEDGSVWAKSLEVRVLPESGATVVTCSGKARSDRDWLAMKDRLGKAKGVKDLQFQQVRDVAPLQFSVSFLWIGDEADGS